MKMKIRDQILVRGRGTNDDDKVNVLQIQWELGQLHPLRNQTMV